MSEPWREAEFRELEWDNRLASAPRCENCGCSIAQYDTYVELDGICDCEKCIDLNTHSTEDLEV